MASEEGELDHNMVIRNLLVNIQGGEGTSGGTNDCVAQLIAAAVAQFGNSPPADSNMTADNQNSEETRGHNLELDPKAANEYASNETEVECTIEIPTVKRRPVCAKFPIELRKRIIALRKEGKKCTEVAKELHISVSGAQKVWERFLATGNVHDRKPSTYAGRPRKYTQQQPQDKLSSLSSETDCAGGNIFNAGEIGNDQEELVQATGADLAGPSDAEPSLIVSYTGNADVLVEGALGATGATVEVVETDPQPPTHSVTSKLSKKEVPAYREQLLLKLVENCPLATLRADPLLAADNPHVLNLSSSINKPLYMEYVLGHPFGKVPCSHPFDGNPEEAKVILSDPANPIGKEMLASLGYSTKVYFNACCKPSVLFDATKIPSNLHFSVGPGFLAETMQAVLQHMLDLCIDPVAALEHIPKGNGLVLYAKSAGVLSSKKFPSPEKLSSYWSNLYSYAASLQCCENFLSATKPSAPCLLCHPFESVVKTLEIQDDNTHSFDTNPFREQSLPTEGNQQIEVQVLQSGQIEFSAQSTFPAESSVHYTTAECADASDVITQQSHAITQQSQPPLKQNPTAVSSEVIAHTNVPTAHRLAVSEKPLIIRRNHNAKYSSVATGTQNSSIDRPAKFQDDLSSNNSGNSNDSQLRRSSRKAIPRTLDKSPSTSSYNLRQKHNQSSSPSTPPTKRTKSSPSTTDQLVLPEEINSNPMEWTIEDVCKFIDTIPRCNYTGTFREHEVDGESLMNLDPEMMVKLMQVKAGPALRIHKKIMGLKKQFNVTT